MELVRDLNERDGVTILAVLHDLALAGSFFPRVLLLDRGWLVADGSPESVLSPEQISRTYEVDARFVPRFSATESR
jgi:iron complex transport system ATP-binding protein